MVWQRGGCDALMNQTDQPLKLGAFCVARVRQRVVQHQPKPTRARKQHDDAGRHFNGFFNVVRHHEDGAQSGFRAAPQTDEFLPKILGSQHIQRAKGFVQTQQPGL